MTVTDAPVTGAPTGPADRRRRRRVPTALAKVQGIVRVLVRPVGRRTACGARRCAHRTRTPGSCSIDVTPAPGRSTGVEAVITADDVPGKLTYGLISQDQPVFAADVVRYVGEPIAAVAADHPETCRRALEAIVVEYGCCSNRCLDPEAAIDGSHAPIHPDGNVIRHQRIVTGDLELTGDVVVEGTYEIGMQDQAFLGLEAALAVPDPGGGVSSCTSRRSGSTRTGDRSPRVSTCRSTRCGSCSAASAGRSVPARTSACRCTRVCSRCGSVDRCGSPTAATRASSVTCIATRRRSGCVTTPRTDGEIVKIEARMVLDGGAYASTSSAVLINAITHTQGPYRCRERGRRRVRGAHQHLPCGAMRGFGVVQACFAHESQMDKLAAACGLDPVEIRLRNAMRDR